MDQHPNSALSRAEAERLGYTVPFADCLARVAISEGTWRRALARTPEDGPRLPMKLVAGRGRGRGRSTYHARPQDLEEYIARVSTPAPLPADALSLIEALSFLAGKPISGKRGSDGDYVLWRGRLRAAVRDGDVTEYTILGVRRYSRAQLEPLKANFDAAGINGHPARQRLRRARAERAEAEGLVNTAETARIANVKRETAERWGGRRLYGARKIGGEWFFERVQIEARPRRAAPGPAEPVTCRHCGKPVMRTRSRRRRAKHYYHGECWEKVWAQRLAEGLAEMDPAELFRRRSEAQQRSWSEEEGVRDSSDYGDGDRLRELHRKPSVQKKRYTNQMVAMTGHPPTREQMDNVLTNVHRRNQADNPAKASADAQGDHAAELHEDGWEIPKIADELHVAIRTVERYLEERGRSERSPGRREAKQRRRIVEHLERVPTNPNGGLADPLSRRDLQRATGLSGSELGARLDELRADVFDVKGQVCVRLVSEKSVTPSLAA